MIILHYLCDPFSFMTEQKKEQSDPSKYCNSPSASIVVRVSVEDVFWEEN